MDPSAPYNVSMAPYNMDKYEIMGPAKKKPELTTVAEGTQATTGTCGRSSLNVLKNTPGKQNPLLHTMWEVSQYTDDQAILCTSEP